MTIATGMMSSATDEWRTPPEILAIVEEILGAIDLDPCAPEGSPFWTGCTTAFTPRVDGLRQEWFGRVYVNPPYGRVVGKWVAKAIHEVFRGHADRVVALVAARPDTAWFRPLLNHPIAFLHGRVRFVDARGDRAGSATFPSALVLISRGYSAIDLDGFGHAVGDRGTIVIPWEAI